MDQFTLDQFSLDKLLDEFSNGWVLLDENSANPHERVRELRERPVARSRALPASATTTLSTRVCADARPAGRHGRVLREHFESVVAGLRDVERHDAVVLVADQCAREHLCTWSGDTSPNYHLAKCHYAKYNLAKYSVAK